MQWDFGNGEKRYVNLKFNDFTHYVTINYTETT